jgi:hypothetical protein
LLEDAALIRTAAAGTRRKVLNPSKGLALQQFI